jgi:hypothetical protein
VVNQEGHVENLGNPGGPNLKARQRHNLLQDLASGSQTIQQLADKYERALGTIHYYKKKYADEIAAIRSEAENEYAGIWVADKKQRLLAYLEDVEQIQETTEKSGVLDVGLLRTKQAALKSIAEELGQLKQHMSVDQSVTYTIIGVDTEDMK